CRVGGVEHLGSDTVYHLEAGGNWIRVLRRRSADRAQGTDGEPGSEIRVNLAVPAALIFED
ncbi:MAG: TOBE domain-containing protein, partial [Gammaproteobacteria bacterium]|nr:TOBE domain-containing protein [Gammaproteobacteria bacterium]